MNKQEEIREGLTLLISECYSQELSACKEHTIFQPQKFLNLLFQYLHSQGVVIKVEGELPIRGMRSEYTYDADGEVEGFVYCESTVPSWATTMMLNAGYTLTELVIEEK